MNIPQELKYGANHEWVRLEGDIAVVGITDFAQQELSDIVYIDCPNVGKYLPAEQVFATVEAVKTLSDIFMPMSGTIQEFNQALLKKPELVNQDPYGEGWIVKIKIDNPQQWGLLMSDVAYKQAYGLN